MKGQKEGKEKPIKVDRVEEWKIERILNKKKIKRIEKYLVQWKGFIVEHDSWIKRKELGNAKEMLEDFEGRMEAKIRRQEKLDRAEE